MSDNKVQGENYLFTKPVRAPFISVDKARKVGAKGAERGEPKFSVTALLPYTDKDENDRPSSPEIRALKAAFIKVAKETWPGRPLGELRFPFVDGAKEAEKATKKGKDGAFFLNHLVFKAASGADKPPQLAIRGTEIRVLQGEQRETLGKEKFYNGCMIVPAIFIKAYKSEDEGGIGAHSGVKAYLQSVLWYGDGARIGGMSAAEVFKSYAGTVTAEDPTGGDISNDEIPF